MSESSVVPLYEKILETINDQSSAGHKTGSDVCHWLTVYDFLAFFCLSKVIEMLSAKCNLADVWGVILPFWLKTIFWRQSYLVCFCFALRTFEYSHKCMAQKWAVAASMPIACLRSVDLEEKTRRRTCCISFGLSFLYALSCLHRNCAKLFLAYFLGSSHPFSLKVEGICTCCFSQGTIILSWKLPLSYNHRR